MAADPLTTNIRFSVQGVAEHRAPLRVLGIIPGDGRGSSFVFARRQLECVTRATIEVRTMFIPSRTNPISLFRAMKEMKRAISEFRPDLIHAHYGTMTSFMAAICTTVPLVITFRGSDLNGCPDVPLWRNHFSRLLSQLSCLRARRIICVSEKLRDRLWWCKNRAVVIPSGVDLRHFYPRPKVQARSRLNWEQSVPTVIFNLGNTPNAKGLDLVRSSIEFAQQTLGPVRLVVLDGSVPHEDIPWYLCAADCVALASANEGSPNIVKEALACNVPVVSTDVGDVAERLEGVSHSRMAARTVTDFSRALVEILSERRSSNGREHSQPFDEQAVADAVCAVYAKVANVRAASPASSLSQHSPVYPITHNNEHTNEVPIR